MFLRQSLFLVCHNYPKACLKLEDYKTHIEISFQKLYWQQSHRERVLWVHWRFGLRILTLSTAFFIHSGIRIQTSIQTPQTRCRSYLMKLLSFIGRRIANNPNAFKSLANILLKSFVTVNSDKEQTIECLRRKEKLSVTKWAYEFMYFYGYALFYTHLINFTQFYACTVLYLFYSFYSVLCLGLFETDSIPVLIMPKIGIFWEFTCSTDGLDWKIFVDFCII